MNQKHNKPLIIDISDTAMAVFNICSAIDLALGLLPEGDEFEKEGLDPASQSSLSDFKVDNDALEVTFIGDSVMAGLNIDGKPVSINHKHYSVVVKISFTSYPCPENHERLD